MSLTEEQKEIIKSSIEDFDMKFSKIKIEFLNMGYKQNDAEDLAWAFFCHGKCERDSRGI